MSEYPFMTVFHCRLLLSALGVIGILRTAPCPVLNDYQMVSLPSSEPVVPLFSPEEPEESVVSPFFVVTSALLMLASRLADISSPVALARSLSPVIYFATLKSSFLSAPPFRRKPMEKMARSGNLTFLPSRSSSLVHATASVRMPLMAPLLKGVL